MRTVNMLEAKSTLSRLVEALETGAETEIIIARNGKPAARLTPLTLPPATTRIGAAKGRFVAPQSIDEDDAEIEALFEGRGD
jgi:antitoxin (DNA-binding transcriptional repressor) of toxin-antitoxin stability system